MSTDTQRPGRHWSGLQCAFRSRRGIALIITLTIMALLLIMATAFVSNMRTERIASRVANDQMKAREIAMAGLHAAIAKMDGFFAQANQSNYVVATMPGRFYGISAWTNGLSISTNMFTTQPNEQAYYYTVLNQRRAVNLNAGSYLWGEQHLPIANPYGNLKTPTPADINNVAIWAEWLPVWRSTDAKIEAVDTTGGLSQSGYKTGIEGRFAFWIDDESVKVNISNAGGPLGLSNVFFTGKQGMAIAGIEPADGKYSAKHLSSVDPAALDLKAAVNANWASKITDLDIGRGGTSGQWKPYRTPEDALGSTSLTLEAYQAAKFCLTTWSEDVDNYSQIFRDPKKAPPAAALPVKRICLTSTNFPCFVVPSPKTDKNWKTARDSLFNNIVQNLKSQHVKYFFGDKASYEDKYMSATANTQPMIGGSVQQIAANIVAYVSAPDVPPIVTDAAGTIRDLTAKDNIPIGACGLRKSLHLNEVAVGFYWYKEPNKAEPKKYDWYLYMAATVELVNPYDDTEDKENTGKGLPREKVPSWMPAGTGGFPESYEIAFDGPIQITGKAGLGELTATIASIPPMLLTSTDAIKPHFYSSIPVTAAPKLVVNGKPQLINKAPITQTDRPTIADLTVELPKIRLYRIPTSGSGITKEAQILDWYEPAHYVSANPNTTVTKVLELFKASSGKFGIDQPADPGTKIPPTIELVLGPNNKTRISIGKNDPRLRFWTKVWGGDQDNTGVTIGKVNKNIDFTGGDIESATPIGKPEYHSNFYIAERSMASVGELGFIHTGRPWRSLSLKRYGAMADETGTIASSPAAIPDWAMMDLFTVNVGPIHGRINVNNAGWQAEADANDGGNASSAPPAWRTRTQPNLFRNTIGYGRRLPATTTSLTYSDSGSPVSHTLAAALYPIFWNDSKKFYPMIDTICRRAKSNPGASSPSPIDTVYKPFFTIGELCEAPNMATYDTSQLGLPVATTDAGREDAIRRMCNVLTTRSDVFCVWVTGQSWWEYWRVLGEARLKAIVQRYVDTKTTPPANRWRIRHIEWVVD